MKSRSEPEDPLTEARRRALASLGRSDRSRESLRQRLAQWGYEEDVVAQVLDRLEAEQWLSDERYARQRAESGARRGWGPRRLKEDLKLQGVGSELTEESLAELEVDWDQRACELATRALSKGKTPEQTARWLLSRGFPGEAVRQALREVPGTLH